MGTTNENLNFDIRVKGVNSWYNKPFFNVSRKAVTWSSPTPTCSLGPWITWDKRRCRTSIATSVKPPSCTLPTSWEKINTEVRTFLNTFKCNLKELTTKSIFSAIGPQYSVYTCQVVRYNLHAVLSMPRGFFQLFSPNPPFLPMVLSPLIFFCGKGACSFPFVRRLMAGLRSCPSQGGIIQAMGWLQKKVTPRYSTHATSI